MVLYLGRDSIHPDSMTMVGRLDPTGRMQSSGCLDEDVYGAVDTKVKVMPTVMTTTKSSL